MLEHRVDRPLEGGHVGHVLDRAPTPCRCSASRARPRSAEWWSCRSRSARSARRTRRRRSPGRSRRPRSARRSAARASPARRPAARLSLIDASWLTLRLPWLGGLMRTPIDPTHGGDSGGARKRDQRDQHHAHGDRVDLRRDRDPDQPEQQHRQRLGVRAAEEQRGDDVVEAERERQQRPRPGSPGPAAGT